jgi:hypothetical protein
VPVIFRTREPPPAYTLCIRLWAQVLADWQRAHPDRQPLFAIPPPGVGLIVSVWRVWPVVCQNVWARELLGALADAARVARVAEPTLTQLTCAIAAAGLTPEFRPLRDFERCMKAHPLKPPSGLDG